MTFPLLKFDRELRYQSYQAWSADYIQDLKELSNQSPWLNKLHLEPKHGLLNDPNGFSYFKGQWHLFYQYFPYGPVHGLKSWHHVVSDDLVHWKEAPTDLMPDSPLDSHGAYSGTAIADGDQLRLFYTGNVRDENWERQPIQNTVTLDTNMKQSSEKKAIIYPLELATDHFRDPMYFKVHDKSWLVIGGQRKIDGKGTLYLYQALNHDLGQWQYAKELPLAQASSAYMFECPNINFVDDKVLVTFCPQGIDQEQLNYQNIYPNAFIIADEFSSEGELVNPGKLQNLDYGFDIYASQIINSPDDRVLGVSWLGLPEIDYPTDAYGQQGALSLIKSYTIQDGHLLQYPIEEMTALRTTKHTFKNKIELANNTYEYQFSVNKDKEAEILLYANQDKDYYVVLSINTIDGKITLNRNKMGVGYGEAFGYVREVEIPPHQPVTVNIFADTSVLEIFVNKGAYVFSSRIFTADQNQRFIYSEGTRDNIVWPLQKN